MAKALEQTQYAGEFQLESLKIFSPSREVFVDLLNVCIQIDIFESIYTSSMTAQIIIVDTENIVDKLGSKIIKHTFEGITNNYM